MGTSFKDLAPYLMGALAGLAGPGVGPSLARGVAGWNRTKDRSDYKRRVKKAEERSDVRWTQDAADRKYRLGERERVAEDREIEQGRADIRWENYGIDRKFQAEDRVTTAKRRATSDAASERAEGRAVAAVGRAESNQAYAEGQRAHLQDSEDRAALAFADLIQTEEGIRWMEQGGVEDWVKSAPSNVTIMKGYADYQQDKDSWKTFSRVKDLELGVLGIDKKVNTLEVERAKIKESVGLASGLLDDKYTQEEEDGTFVLRNSAQTRLNQIDTRLKDLAETRLFLTTYGAVSGYGMGTPQEEKPKFQPSPRSGAVDISIDPNVIGIPLDSEFADPDEVSNRY